MTANTVVLKFKRETIYRFYYFATDVIRNAIDCIHDKHQAVIAELLYIKGMPFIKAQEYMGRYRHEDLYSIAPTTFAEARRKAIIALARMFSLNGILDLIVKRSGNGRNKDEYGFILANWTKHQQ